MLLIETEGQIAEFEKGRALVGTFIDNAYNRENWIG